MIAKKKIKDVAFQISGVTYKKSDVIENIEKGYIPILRSNNINEGCLNYEDLVFVPSNIVKKNQILQSGDILITSSTGSKKVIGKNGNFENKIEASFGAFCKVIRAKENVYPLYLKFFFQSKIYREEIKNIVNGANINNIRKEHLDNLIIPIPDFETQKAIAAKLDAADALRQKDQELLEHYDQLAQSIFIDMFGDPVLNEKGWEVRELNKVAPFHMSKHTPDVIKGKYWMLNLDAVEKNTGAILEKKMISTKSVSSSTYFFDETQVLYSKLRPYLNKVVIPFEKGVATTELVPLNPKKDLINRLFLATLLRSKSFVNYIEIKVSGAKMPRVDMNSLRTFKTILPPIHLQTQFAEKIKNIEAQKALVRQQAEQSEMLFQALLQESFAMETS